MVVVEGLGYPLPRVFPVPARAGWLHLTFGLSLATIALNITLRSLHDALSLARQQLEERKKAEGALRESEERFRTLAEASFEGIALTEKGVIVDLNDQLASMLGYDRGELIGKPVMEAVALESRELVAEAIRSGRLEPYGHLALRKDGTTFPVEVCARTTQMAGRQLRVTAIRDVTERKQAEEVLRESEERHRSLFENSPISLWEEDFSLVKEYFDDLRAMGVTDFRAFFENRPEAVAHCAELVKVLDVNKATVALVGAQDKDELLAGLSKILADEAVVVFQEELITLAEGGQWFESEEVHRTLSGEERFIVLSLSVVPGYADSLGKVLVSVLDITERKRTEEALQESERKYRFITEKMADAVWLMDMDFKPAFISPSVTRMLGYTLEELQALSLDELLTPESFEFAMKTVATELSPERLAPRPYERSLTVELEFRRKDGSPFWSESTLTLLRDSDGRPTSLMGVGRDITERKRAEEALRESEERFKGLFEQSPFSIQILDTNGWTLQVNKGWEQLWNSTPDMLANYNMLQDPQLEESGTLEYLKKAFSGEAVRIPPIEYSVEKQVGKGPTRWVQARAFPVKDDSGNVREVIVMHEDFTEQRRAEEALKESEKKFRTFTESAPVAIMIYRDYYCVYANPEVERMTGYTRQELEQMKFADFVHPDYKDIVIEAGKALERGESPPYESDFKIIAKDGDEKWLDGRLEMIDYEGRCAALISAMDITERKRAEEALRESEERYRRLAEAAHDMIFILNREGNVDYANSFATQQFGRLPGEIIGRPHAELFLSDDAKRQQVGLRQVFEGGQPLYVESLTQFPNRRMWLGTWLVPIKDEAGQVKSILGVSRDITERKQAEEEIQRLNAELEQRVVERTAQLEAANKELEAFSYSVSHDLRAPLRAVDGFSRILLEDYMPQLPPEVVRYLRVIFENTQQMGRLIDDLLAFSRLSRQPLHKQPVAPTDLVRQALQSLSGEQVGRRIEISIGELPACQGDPALLRQVWINLLSNALKFTREQDVARIEIGCRTQEDGASVYFVKDNGVGFDLQYAAKLFGVFQRLHRVEEYEGTGVGLAIVQRIIHRHGGRVWAEAEVNKGATFYFTI